MKKTALIFGVTGQDGSHLLDLLLDKNYKTYGVSRRVSVPTDERIKQHQNDTNFELLQGDVTDYSSVSRIIKKYQPNEIYNLSAQSHVGISFDEPCHTWDVVATGAINILEAVRQESPKSRVYQASSSEMFGASYIEKNCRKIQDENTPFMPQSPYAVAKLAAHHSVRIYRNSYKMFTSSGILFNHEGERRGENFVTRKISKYIGRLMSGKEKNKLKLGNIYSYRDWGYAGDYVNAMWLMLQQDKPDDYVIATGITHTVKDFLEIAFKHVGLNWGNYVETDLTLLRPSEVDYLCGDTTKATNELKWKPKVMFEELVRRMVEYDIHESR